MSYHNKKIKKYLKSLYKRNNSVEKQYILLIFEDSVIQHYLISKDSHHSQANTDKHKIENLRDDINAADSILIVHNHPGMFSSANPSTLDFDNQIYIENELVKLGKNLTDYLIFSKKGIYSFKTENQLVTGIHNRVSKQLTKMQNPLQSNHFSEIINHKQYLQDLIGNESEAILTSKKLFISDALPIDKVKYELQNEQEPIVMLINTREEKEARISLYKQLLSPDEIILIDGDHWESSIDLGFFNL